MSEPKHKRHKSEQEVGTPPEFIAAIEKRWGKITLDLAASDKMHVCDEYFTPQIDGLKQDWNIPAAIEFCNPPFGKIGPWVKKAAYTTHSTGFMRPTILILVPAAIETRWFRDHVYTHAKIHILVPRLKFVGHDSGFTKGLVLCEYPAPEWDIGFYYWHWR
ncbi:MAG: DNA N-6-adenine-methyltransferase [Parcubacteria group bacterium]